MYAPYLEITFCSCLPVGASSIGDLLPTICSLFTHHDTPSVSLLTTSLGDLHCSNFAASIASPPSSRSLRQSRIQTLASGTEGLGCAEVQKRLWSLRYERGKTKALQVLLSKILGLSLSHLQVSGGCELMKGYTDSGKTKNGGLGYMKVILITVFDWTSYKSFVSNYSAAQEHECKSHKVPKCS